jgi:hypothetical protein
MHLIVKVVLNLKNKVIDTIKYDGIKYKNEKVYDDSFYKFIFIIDNKNRIEKLINSIKDNANFEVKYVGEDKFTDVERFTFSTLSKDGEMRKFFEDGSLDLRTNALGEKIFLDIEVKT